MKKHEKKNTSTPVVMPDGTVFPSQAACGRHYNLSASAIANRVKRGLLQDLQDNGRQPPKRYSPLKDLPFTIAGVVFPSARFAANVLGYSVPYLRQVMLHGKPSTLRLLAKRVMYYVNDEKVRRAKADATSPLYVLSTPAHNKEDNHVR